MLIDIGDMRHRFSRLIDDKTRATRIRKLINTLGRNHLNKLNLSIFLGEIRQMIIDQGAPLKTILIEVNDDKVLQRGISNLPDILIPSYLHNLPVLNLLGLFLEPLQPVFIVLLGKLVLKVQIVLHLLQLLLVLTV